MGNTSEADLKKLALHMLNRTPNRTYPHPKVTVKKVSGVVVDCYSSRDWLERNKRKQAVRKYLYLEKRSLGFYDSEGDYRKDKWKAFKKKYDITKATKQLLLTAPGEEFFSVVKRPSSKNKSCKEISPFAEQFFKVFLKSKGRYQKPESRVYFRPYDTKADKLSCWSPGVWEDGTNESLKLAVMDFRNIPGVINKDTAPADAPYFIEFLDILGEEKEPSLTDPEVWLWITGDKDVDDDLRAYIRNGTLGANYNTHFAQYVPAVVERLEDLTASSKRAKVPVNLIFLLKKAARVKSRVIPHLFEVPDSTK
jgi:hypothetical protein